MMSDVASCDCASRGQGLIYRYVPIVERRGLPTGKDVEHNKRTDQHLLTQYCEDCVRNQWLCTSPCCTG